MLSSRVIEALYGARGVPHANPPEFDGGGHSVRKRCDVRPRRVWQKMKAGFRMRWHYRDPGLLWPFVPAYLIHVAEEWFAGFPLWLEQIVGRPVPGAAFLLINAVALAMLIAAIRAATRAERSGWLAVAIATI